MKKLISTYILVLSIFLFTPSKAQNTKEVIKSPESFKILGETEGDLDNDGISEKVIVYETNLEIGRQIYIYKKTNDEWGLWEKSSGAILPFEGGGMMGDPFQKIWIERNCIVINHFGGSRQKWNYTNRYRYQSGEFQLIGVTVIFGSPCDYFFTFDYNLSNGKINYEKEIEDCENKSSKIEKEEMIRKLETLPKMNDFYPGDNELKLSKSGTIIYY
jgi:hypothetical protein